MSSRHLQSNACLKDMSIHTVPCQVLCITHRLKWAIYPMKDDSKAFILQLPSAYKYMILNNFHICLHTLWIDFNISIITISFRFHHAYILALDKVTLPNETKKYSGVSLVFPQWFICKALKWLLYCRSIFCKKKKKKKKASIYLFFHISYVFHQRGYFFTGNVI